MSQLRQPADAHARAKVYYRNNVRSWLGGSESSGSDSGGSAGGESGESAGGGDGGGFTPLVYALGSPSRAFTEANPDQVTTWINTWRSYTGPGQVEWGTKNLGTFGATKLPVRVLFDAPEKVARAAGAAGDYQQINRNWQRLTSGIGPAAKQALTSTFGHWRGWDNATITRCVAVVKWLRENDSTRYYVRELPIFGVDSKWVETHRAVLVAVCGDVVFKQSPGLIEVRGLGAATPHHALPETGLEALPHAHINTVVIVENRTTFLALPWLPDTLAIWGGGYRAASIAGTTWLPQKRLFYWGDLDTQGFGILNQLRARLPGIRSILMDRETATQHWELGVTEPSPVAGELTHLTPEEQAVFAQLREHQRRIEQERIRYDYAVGVLEQHIGSPTDAGHRLT